MLSNVWNLLKDEGNITMEDSYGICQALWDCHVTKGAKRELEADEVSIGDVEGLVIISNEEVVHGVARVGCNTWTNL